MTKRAGGFGLANAADDTSPVPPAVAVSPGQTKAHHLFNDPNAPGDGGHISGADDGVSGADGDIPAPAVPGPASTARGEARRRAWFPRKPCQDRSYRLGWRAL